MGIQVNLGLVLGLALVVWSLALGKCSYDSGYDTALTERIASYEQAAKDAEDKAKHTLDLERKAYKDQEAISASYLDKIKRLQHNEQALITEYRANTLSLRESLKVKQCPDVSAVAGATSSGDAGTTGGLQDADVTFLIRHAARADEVTEQLHAAQQVILNHRELCNANQQLKPSIN